MRHVLFLATLLLAADSASGYFLDGEGHYGLRPETQTNPGFASDRGLHQGTFQSFRLLGRARANDKLSMNLEFRLFENPRYAFLGDTARPEECAELEDGAPSNEGSSQDCDNKPQDSGQPGYESYNPKLQEAYVEYAFEHCLLKAGRRGRNWGSGIFLDDGHDPFDTSASVFDGVECNVNIQKLETLGFAVGFDRLTESGVHPDVAVDTPDQYENGASKTSDDLDQLFVSIEYDDRKANAGAFFNRQIGIYVANVLGSVRSRGEEDQEAVKTDIKFADLYTGLYFRRFAWRNEVLFRLGKSAESSWARYGGLTPINDDKIVRMDLNSIAFAGDMVVTLARSGTVIGPEEYKQGTASSHDLFFEYAHAPGDRDGYYDQAERRADHKSSAKKVNAMAFHRNYKPAMILFNGNPEIDDLRVDGIFDPGRVMNATVLATGYRYKSLPYGNFEVKLISAEMNVSIPDGVKKDIKRKERADEAETEASTGSADNYSRPNRPIGFSGNHLGYELDLKYSYPFGKDVELGIAGAAALPGSAWRVAKESPQASYLIQSTVIFRF